MTWKTEDNRDYRNPNVSPDVLLGYQQRWIADNSPVKFCEKSRRIGLSWSEAAEDALLAARSNGMDVFYIGYNYDMAREFIEDVGDWARHYNLAAREIEDFIWKDEREEKKDIQAFRVRFPSGYKITALSSRPSNIRGKQGKIVIDEAAFHDDLPGLLKAAMAMLIWGGRVVVISTHFGEDNPFNDEITQIRAGKKPYSLHRITFDDALGEGLYRRVCLRKGIEWSAEDEIKWRQTVIGMYGDDAEEELHCVPSRSGGTFMSITLIESVMDERVEVIRWKPPYAGFVDKDDITRYVEVEDWCKKVLLPHLMKLPSDLKTYFGEDFGRVADLSIFWPIVETPGLTWHTPFVLELFNCPFSQQEQILFFMVDRLPIFSGGALDARGNGAFLAERARQRYGNLFIEEVQLSANWYLNNMPPLKNAFEDGTINIPKHTDYRDDFRAIKKINGIPKIPDSARTDSKSGGKRHGDGAIASCMALYAARNIEGDFGKIQSAMPRQAAQMFRGYYNQ
jgi:phage FluMu gp28-like protein